MNENDFENQELSDNDAEEGKRLVPVGEAIRYRKRAQSAESRVDELGQELEKINSKNERLLQELDNIKQENALVSKLVEAGTNDIEAAVLIAKKRLEKQDDKNIDAVIDQLAAEKEHLFVRREPVIAASKTSGAKQRGDDSRTGLERVAQKASSSGNRIDVHEYMRARRQFIK